MTTTLPEEASTHRLKARAGARTNTDLNGSVMKPQKQPRKKSLASQSAAPPETLGQRVKRLMEEKGFNQTSLARRTGIERTELNRLVNDRRQPRNDELAWLAQALDVTIEVLLEGVDLPEELRKTLALFEDAARRVLVAEGERDEIRERLAASEEEHAGERRRWEDERHQLEAQAKAARDESARVVSELSAQVGAAEQALEDERRARADDRGRAELALKHAAASADVLRNQVIALQRELARERSSKIATGFIAGLAGLFGGAALGSSSGRSGVTDDDDDQ